MTRVQILGMESVSEEPKISQTIKENPYEANTELEGAGKGRKGEVVIRPDLSAIHNVVGKRHYAGGVKTWLPEGSFVISDYGDLAFNKEDHLMMELKEGGSFKKGDNTPSEVLRRNIDVKHYNKMSNTLSDKNKDSISKKTAELMLGKYTETLGKIAFKQEEKKGFPNGVPDFAQGTAPVYDSSVKEDLKEDKQYMKYGGRTLSKFQMAGTTGVNIPKWGYQTPALEGINGNYVQGFHGEKVWIPFNKTSVPQQIQTTSTQSTSNTQGPLSGADQGNVTGFGENSTTPANPYKVETPAWWPKNPSSECPPNHYWNSVIGKCIPNAIKQETYLPVPPVRKDMPWNFSPWQKLSMLQGWNNYANVERLMPMRSNISSPLVELEKTVEPSYLGELASGFRANQVMNPYLAGNNNNQMYGQMLNADRTSRANFINQNVQIGNQQNLMNNQIQRQDLAANVGADQQYYHETIEGRKNFNNARDVVRETNNNELKGNVEMNQQLAMKLAQLGPNSPWGYDFKKGQFYITGKGSIDNAIPGQTQDDYVKMATDLKQQGFSDAIISAILKSSTFAKLPMSRGMKQGGRFNPYR